MMTTSTSLVRRHPSVPLLSSASSPPQLLNPGRCRTRDNISKLVWYAINWRLPTFVAVCRSDAGHDEEIDCCASDNRIALRPAWPSWPWMTQSAIGKRDGDIDGPCRAEIFHTETGRGRRPTERTSKTIVGRSSMLFDILMASFGRRTVHGCHRFTAVTAHISILSERRSKRNFDTQLAAQQRVQLETSLVFTVTKLTENRSTLLLPFKINALHTNYFASFSLYFFWFRVVDLADHPSAFSARYPIVLYKNGKMVKSF